VVFLVLAIMLFAVAALHFKRGQSARIITVAAAILMLGMALLTTEPMQAADRAEAMQRH